MGGQPAACAGSAPANVRSGRSAARPGPGPVRMRCGAASRTAAAHGGSAAPSHSARRSALQEEESLAMLANAS